MKESIITMLEQLVAQMEDMKLNETSESARACNIGIDSAVKIVKDKISHIRVEVSA